MHIAAATAVAGTRRATTKLALLQGSYRNTGNCIPRPVGLLHHRMHIAATFIVCADFAGQGIANAAQVSVQEPGGTTVVQQ
ncbi:MAG: hypothetical protein K8963_03920 [Proteobacteria bacterium]|nr:hypothetical protein [Pseudomonadota bacterium]